MHYCMAESRYGFLAALHRWLHLHKYFHVHNVMLLLQVRKQERTWKQSADEHATAVLALEAKLAGKQREVADLQEVNSSLFSRFQAMRHQLARTEDKLSHDKLKGGVTLHCNVPEGLLCLLHVHCMSFGNMRVSTCSAFLLCRLTNLVSHKKGFGDIQLTRFVSPCNKKTVCMK